MSAYEKYMAELPEDVERLEAEIERLTARNKLLEDVAEAGNRLQNEVHGSLQYLDRSVCGNTNYVCLQTAAIATREAIAKLQEQKDGNS